MAKKTKRQQKGADFVKKTQKVGKKKLIYHYSTCATDTGNMKAVIGSVRDTLQADLEIQ